jgi:hypothetical protein
MEPWTFQVKVSETLSEGHKISLVSPQRLDVNLTMGFIDTILNAFNTWTEDYYDLEHTKASTQSLAAFSYYIRNNTGSVIWYWAEGKVAVTGIRRF